MHGELFVYRADRRCVWWSFRQRRSQKGCYIGVVRGLPDGSFVRGRIVRIAATCTVLAVGSLVARADRVPLARAPEPVQKAINEQSNGEAVRRVDRKTKDGKTIYQAEFKRKGINRRLQFNADGTPWLGDRSVADVVTTPALNRLPPPVQKTLEQQRAGRVVTGVDKKIWQDQAVYEIRFRERGPDSRIYIAEDGALLKKRFGAPPEVRQPVREQVEPAPINQPEPDRPKRDLPKFEQA
jgi:hypothetical protein